MEEPIREEDEGYVSSRDRHKGRGLLFERNTYITDSKKFHFTWKEFLFSIFYSLIFGLIPAIGGILLLDFNENTTTHQLATRFFSVLVISMLFIFILRVFFKRGMQIFSISLIGILALITLFFWAIIPKERNICTKHEGNFIQSDEIRRGDDRLIPPDYTCFVNQEVLQQVSSKESFPYNFMNFEVKK